MDILSEDLGESGASTTGGGPSGPVAAVAALKPKVLTARDLEEQQKEAAKSEEIVKAKVSHISHHAFEVEHMRV